MESKSTADFLKDVEDKWYCKLSSHRCKYPGGCEGFLKVMYQVVDGKKVNAFLICDSPDAEGHKYMHRLASYDGLCRACNQPIHCGQIIIRHEEKRHLWVHSKCAGKVVAAHKIVCYICLQECLKDEKITKVVNGGRNAYRHTLDCVASEDNPNVIDIESEFCVTPTSKKANIRNVSPVKESVRNADLYVRRTRARSESGDDDYDDVCGEGGHKRLRKACSSSSFEDSLEEENGSEPDSPPYYD